MFEGYRDATYSVPNFRLQLIDCWRGLARAVSKAWVKMPSDGMTTMWGMMDEREVQSMEGPLDGDLNVIVPDRFMAFRGPRRIEKDHEMYEDTYTRGALFTRFFSPSFYIPIFQSLGVTTVIRLNEACHYDPADFEESGIRHFDLFFEDCTAPPPNILSRFFHIVDGAKGMIAIHCTAGLGRTGTLIALELMRSHGFGAREAMGWLRIMRPGSVIGVQQRFLCEIEPLLPEALEIMRAAAANSRSPGFCELRPSAQSKDNLRTKPGGMALRRLSLAAPTRTAAGVALSVATASTAASGASVDSRNGPAAGKSPMGSQSCRK
jgi:hypothetical protein